jgi:ABC-type uncharacterized transport system substrate-binding protein
MTSFPQRRTSWFRPAIGGGLAGWVSRNPDLIIAIASRFVLDVKAATSTIPIVGLFADLIGWGIAPNLARPGGNIEVAPVG